jgi:hypothetical protein
MEITIEKPHQTIYHFNGEVILDMKYEYTLRLSISQEHHMR